MTLPASVLIISVLAQLDGGAAIDAGPAAPTMVLEIAGVRSTKGHVLIAVYRAGDRFSEAGQTAFRKERIPAQPGTMMVEVKDLPVDTYALALIHDENDNLKLDTGLFGIPVEGFCFSKNAMGLFGPPSFKAAAVSHAAQGGTQKLRVKY
ncbi:MAG: DUF2141 domain-containing protein [Myxococcaceae bacterium]|nr:DUF2141 domain-containing protein [Myxococcaceae bacterium]